MFFGSSPIQRTDNLFCDMYLMFISSIVISLKPDCAHIAVIPLHKHFASLAVSIVAAIEYTVLFVFYLFTPETSYVTK